MKAATPRSKSIHPELPLVGRIAEVDLLKQRMEAARSGSGSVVVIQGDPGLGKTRLTRAIRELATEAGMTCLEGRCLEGMPVPYLPIADILESTATLLTETRLPALTGETANQLLRVAPGLEPMLGEFERDDTKEHAEQDRHALFAAVRTFIDSLSRVSPLLLIVEDIHWADEPSLLLLRYLLRLPLSRRVVVVLTQRTMQDGATDLSTSAGALVAEIERGNASDVLRLGELSLDGVSALVSAICGREPPSYVSSRLYERIGGNPLFVEQVVFELLNGGRLFDDRDRWIELSSLDSLPIPAGVRSVVRTRLQRAGDDTRFLLNIAAVAGQRSDYRLISAVSGLAHERVLAAVEEAEHEKLIAIEDGERGLIVAFTHDLIRQEILSQLSLPRLRSTHLALAQAIESNFDISSGERDFELAVHYLGARSAENRVRTVQCLQSAAGQATRAMAFEDGVRLYEEALALLGASELEHRCALLLQLGEARKRVSDSDLARAAFEEAAAIAEQTGDPESFAAAALGYSRSWPSVGAVDERAVALLSRALEMASEHDLGLKARLLAKYALQTLYSGAPEAVLSRARDAVVCSRNAGDLITLARALQVLHAAMWQPRYLHERINVADEIVRLADQIGDPSVALWGIRPRIADLMEMGDVAGAESDIESYDVGASRSRVPIYLWQAAVRRAMLAIFRGNLDEGESLARKSLELGRQAEGQNLIAAFGGQLLIIRWQQGRLEELRPLIEASRRNELDIPLWAAVLAFIEVEAGNRGAASDLLDELAVDRFAALTREDSGLVVIVLASLVCHRLGNGIRAEQLFELLAPYEGRNVVVSEGVASVGAAAGYLGMLAATSRRLDDAERLLRDAIEMNASIGGRPWLARSQFELARVLLTRRKPGDRREASQLIRTALGVSRDRGYLSLQSDIERFQRAHKRLTPDRPDGLTARETEVLALIAAGSSTREISDALVLSTRTTARHVTNIYAKIGARNRVEATAYALRHGIGT
jgi:DNA-binding CsgD family transcriptional regulator/tetratricopeptide (TPR) repeat protein